MRVVSHVHIGPTEAEKTVAADLLCALIELAIPQAQAEVKGLPGLYKSGVRYRKQPEQVCDLSTPRLVFSKRGGDCKQLVLWRLAELRNGGERATPRIMWLREHQALRAHALIRRSDNTIEDPSVILGMRQTW